MYLKHSPDYIDSKYIWVHRPNSLGSSVSAEIPFLALKGGGVALPELSYICIPSFRSVAPRVFLVIIPFFFFFLFFITVVTIFWIF